MLIDQKRPVFLTSASEPCLVDGDSKLKSTKSPPAARKALRDEAVGSRDLEVGTKKGKKPNLAVTAENDVKPNNFSGINMYMVVFLDRILFLKLSLGPLAARPAALGCAPAPTWGPGASTSPGGRASHLGPLGQPKNT